MIHLILHEARIYFRQVVYWVTFALVVVVSLTLYSVYSWDHAQLQINSPVSPHPRYMVDFLGGLVLAMSLLMACFYGRNVFTKDRFYRIDEVVDSKPAVNLRIVLSKVIVLVIVTSLPVYTFILCIQFFAGLHAIFDVTAVRGFEPFTLLKFLFITCPCSVFLFASLCVLVNRVCRFNLLTLAVMFGVLMLCFRLLGQVTPNSFVFFEALPMLSSIGSDMIQSSISPLDLLRYLNFVLVALLCCFLTVVLMNRTDPLNKVYWLVIALLGLVCTTTTSGLLLNYSTLTTQITEWREAYQLLDGEPNHVIDIEAINAKTLVTPGKTLHVEVELYLVVSGEIDQSPELLFSLNPGFQVLNASVDGVSSEFASENGVLSIVATNISPNNLTEVRIVYQGRPNTKFGYLDSSIDVDSVPVGEQLLSYLGTQNAIFSRQYAALPHGVSWLPLALENFRPNSRSKDFFTTDFTISVPMGWEVSLPGVLVPSSSNAQAVGRSLRFVSNTPVGSVDLFAGPLQRRSITLEEVEFVVLANEQQMQTLAIFAEHQDRLFERVTELLTIAEDAGYKSSCETVRLISVPHDLRLYSSGVFMNSIMAGPCYFLLREHGFWTVNFDSMISDNIRWVGQDSSNTFVAYIEYYFRENRFGLNLGLDLANNFFDYQIGVTGPEAVALEIILSYLHDLIWTEPMGAGRYMDKFSISAFLPHSMEFKPAGSNFGLSPAMYRRLSIVMWFFSHHFKTHTMHIDKMLSVSNQELESEVIQTIALENSLHELLSQPLTPKVIEAIRLKCVTLSQKLFYALGTEKARDFLQKLVQENQFRNFSLQDVYRLADLEDIPLQSILGDWFELEQNPVFKFSTLETFLRLDPTGSPYFQTFFDVMNEGESTGILQTTITSRFSEADLAIWGPLASEAALYAPSTPGPTVWVAPGEVVQVGVMSETQPYRVNVQNTDLEFGGGFTILWETGFTDQTGTEFTPVEQFVGYRQSDWTPLEEEIGIVIDDLDAEFSVDRRNSVEQSRSIWTRYVYSAAWGSKRPTFVYSASDRDKRAIFTATIPEGGQWKLEFHVPDLRARFNNNFGWRFPNYNSSFWHNFIGDYVFSTQTSGQKVSFELSINESDFGWVSVCDVWLDQGLIEVIVTASEQSQHLFADAIRWTKITPGSQ
ncbi:MAG: hypothetical protein OXH84_08665 [Gammaproteobacteria bacterium]|nr:hypothetical protein [Gammaproteobacteria bacterium]